MALTTQLARYHGALQKLLLMALSQELTQLDEEVPPASTTQCSSLGSIVTFGAGLSVMGFLTGFESCVVLVRGLPTDAREREIYDLFTQQGIDKARLYLKSNRVVEGGTREVKMVMDSGAGTLLSVGLDMLEFRDRSLSFEVHEHSVPGKMTRVSARDADVLTISWREPSVGYIATLTSMEDARWTVKKLDGTLCLGRRIKAAMYILPHSTSSTPLAPLIRITGLPASATDSDITGLVGDGLVHLHRSGVGCANVKPVDVIRVAAYAAGCREKGDIVSIDRTESADDVLHGIVKLRARFRTWGYAKGVYNYLIGRKLSHGTLCRLALPFPLTFTIPIPILQYIAQRFAWTELHQLALEVGYDQCRLETSELPGEPTVQITVSGGDPKIVGPLKVKVEELASSGELVTGWHPRLAQLEYREGPFVNRALIESGAFICIDSQRQQIRVYGSPEAVVRGRSVIQGELARLAGPSETQAASVPREAARDFMTHGVPKLCEVLGEENVHFDPTTCALTVSGGHEARHLIFRVILAHAGAPVEPLIPAGLEDVCPICYDTVHDPVHLACGHTYCTPCLRHFLRSAIDSETFPLACMGDEARCSVPIPVHLIERFLSKQLFARLLQAVFRVYIARNPLALRYCKTPNCQQIYRVVPQAGPRPVPTKCPDCLVVVCPGCDQGAHEGYTCAEHRARTDPDEQERLLDAWVSNQGGRVQRCPRCRLPLEKTAGCNHVTCRCGVHICWRCWLVHSESADDIYRHMRSAHGGYHA